MTVPAALQSVEQELLLHAAALRSLARDLVGERSADDLVQETALRALRMPPQRPTVLFHWLATILRRLASKQRRAERRRWRHEQAASRPEPLPPADALVLRREMLRTVTDAVLGLPEPYQSALLRRYFEDLTPTAIAAVTGVPLATVKSRLQRGLALLREDLDRRDARQGDQGTGWRAALSATTGWCSPALVTATGFAMGVALMTKLAKIVAVAALLVASSVIWFTWPAGPLSPPMAPPSDAPLLAVDKPAAGAAERAEPRPAERTLAVAPALLAELALPHAFELRCRVVDRDGLPVSGAQLFLAPRGCAMNTADQTTDADGVVVIRWRGRQPTMTIALGVRRNDVSQSLQELQVDAGAPRQCTLLGEQLVTGIVAAAGVRVRAVKLRLDLARTGPCAGALAGKDCRGCHKGANVRGAFDSRLSMRKGLHPDATFADLVANGDHPIVESRELLQQRQRKFAKDLLLAAGREPADDGTGPGGRLAGTVYDAAGRPAAGQTVVWGDDLSSAACRAITDDAGRFLFPEVPAGRHSVRVGGGDAGIGVRACEVFAGQETHDDHFLQLGAVVRGHAIGSDGAPLARAQIEYVSATGHHVDAATVRQDGTFVLANLPPGLGRLLLWSPGGVLPIAVKDGVLPDCADVDFDLRRATPATSRLQLFVELPVGVDQGSCEVRVWQEDSGRGTAMEQTRDGLFSLDGLVGGFYRVEVGGIDSGWRDLGRQWIDGSSVCDLGRVQLAPPCQVLITPDPSGLGVPEFYLRRPDGDVRAEEVAGAAAAGAVSLPAGDWWCLWSKADGQLGCRPLTCQSGGKVQLRLDER